MSPTQLLKCFKQEASKIGFGFCEVMLTALYKTDGRVVVAVRVEGLFEGCCNPLGERVGISIRMVLVEMEMLSENTLRRPNWQGLTQQH